MRSRRSRRASSGRRAADRGIVRARGLAPARARWRSCPRWTRSSDSPASSRTRLARRARRSSSCSSTSSRAELAAVIEADKLGQLRTGAASGVAAKHLAKPDATNARRDRLRLAGREPGRVHPGGAAGDRARSSPTAGPRRGLLAFCEKVGAEPGESHRDPAEQDVVVTVTTSDDPVLRGEWLAAGDARLRGRREPAEGARARQRRPRTRRPRLLRLDRAGEARVGRPDRARRPRRPRLARGARAARSRLRRAPGTQLAGRHRRSSSRTGSRPGTLRSAPARSSSRTRGRSGSASRRVRY